jgi:hypothetical protein
MHPSPMAKEHGDRSIGEALVARDRDCDGRQSVAPSRMIPQRCWCGVHGASSHRHPWRFLSPSVHGASVSSLSFNPSN